MIGSPANKTSSQYTRFFVTRITSNCAYRRKRKLCIDDDSDEFNAADKEDQDFQLALELSKEEAERPPRRISSIKSFIEDEDESDYMGEDKGKEKVVPVKKSGKKVRMEVEDEDEVFEDEAFDEDIEESEDEAFSGDESDEEFESKPKGKKKAAAPAKAPKAAAKSKARKEPVARKPAAKKGAASKASVDTESITAKAPIKKQIPVTKPSYASPNGVKIKLEGAPVRRVGLSRLHAPQGPLSPVKIKKA